MLYPEIYKILINVSFACKLASDQSMAAEIFAEQLDNCFISSFKLAHFAYLFEYIPNCLENISKQG